MINYSNKNNTLNSAAGRILSASIVVLFGLIGQAQELNSQSVHPDYFQLKAPTIREIETTELLSPMDTRFLGGNKCEAIKPMTPDLLGGVAEASVAIDQVVNLGKKIWTIVSEGKPVVNYKSDIAMALPQGVNCWTDLTNWSNPLSRTYEIVFENGFGMEVIKLQYRVITVYGGSYQGQGRYIGYVTVVPAELNVGWGFNLDVQASVPTVFNQGSKENPVAAMTLDLKWKTTTILQSQEGTDSFFVNGMGQFQQLK